MKRKTFLGLMAMAAATPVIASCTSSNSGSSSSTTTSRAALPDALKFDPSAYEEKTETFTHGGKDIEVTYRQWTGVVYCANPVDKDYQCMNIKQPITVDGKSVDTKNMPIVMALNIGGYMSYAPNKASSIPTALVPGGIPAAGGAAPGGAAPGGAPAGAPGGDAGGNNGVAAGVGTQVGGMGGRVDNGEYAMVAGCVAIDTGARGRDNQASDGTYYGKAPAAIVDLKSAVRYLRANKDNGIPGNTERIVCTGSSAGGALTALLGASGDSSLYDSYLKEVGAADASDSIYAAAPYCPITDLEHADAGYEWVLGKVSSQKVTVDQTVSDALAALFPAYFNSLNIKNVTADNLADYILSEHIVPSAEAYLQGLSDSDRTTYLQNNPWITYNNGKVSFSWSDYTEHIGRSKSAPAFDAFDLSAPENKEFGSKTVSARHFSDYSAQHENTTVEQEVKDLLPLMNPVHFLSDKNPNRAKHWFMRVGTSDTDTSPAVLTILAALAQQAGDNVDVDYYWDQGHGTNIDPEKFAAWVKSLA